MVEAVRLHFVVPCYGGLRTVEAWAPSPDAEIVVHPEIGTPADAPSSTWRLSHRRSGHALNHIRFERRDIALDFAADISDLPGFKAVRVERLEDGPQFESMAVAQALRDEVTARLTAFCERLRP